MKKDFPIFKNNPDLIFFDSTASSQKPKYVIDGITHYLENDYSNIHRGMYDIAIRSEALYKKSKQKISQILNGKSWREVIYTFNSTYAVNLLAASIKKTGLLQKGDKILVSIVEHHANIVPWLILKEEIGIEIEYVNVDEDFLLDLDDFKKKYDDTVKILSFTHVSNVVWWINPLEKIGQLKKDNTLFIIDASQSVPHMHIDVEKLNCDALFFTWHKVLADSWIGVLWWKQDFLNSLKPAFSWGGAIREVALSTYSNAGLPDKFEPGTPNVTWAVSLLKAFEYIESIWWYDVIEDKEKELVEYFLAEVQKIPQIHIIGSKNPKNRVSVFSFIVDGFHSDDVADYLAEHGVAVRSWKHCAHPLFSELWYTHSIRVSMYIYNEKREIDIFMKLMQKLLAK